MSRAHTSVNLDPDLVKMAKEFGGYGILTRICTLALEQYLSESPLPGVPEDLRLAIEEERNKPDRKGRA